MTEAAPALVVVGGCGRVGARFVALARTELPDRQIVSIDRASPAGERDGVVELIGDAADPGAELVARLRKLRAFELVLLNAMITDEGDGAERMEAMFEANAVGAVAIARACRVNLRKVVFASSVEAYGVPTGDAPFGEDQTLAPVTAYGVTKLAGELAVGALSHEIDVACVILRFTSIYGSAPPLGNALEGFYERARRGDDVTVFGDGSARRDFLHVDDAACAIVAALRYPGSGTFNVANPEVLSLGVLARLAVDAAGAGRVVHEAGRSTPAHRVMDTSRMTGLLRFNPAVDAREGLRRLGATSGFGSGSPDRE